MFLICCFFLSRVLRVNRKPEKSEHKLLQPASPVSHEQPSYGGWAPQPLTLIQPSPSPSIRTDLCFTKIIQPLCSLSAPAQSLLLLWSEPVKGKKVHHDEGGLCSFNQCLWHYKRNLTPTKMLLVPYSHWHLKRKEHFPSFENISIMVRWFSVVCHGQSCCIVWLLHNFFYILIFMTKTFYI